MYISAQGIKTGASAAETGQFELLPVLIAPVARHWRAAGALRLGAATR